jgi:hypothetical protein
VRLCVSAQKEIGSSNLARRRSAAVGARRRFDALLSVWVLARVGAAESLPRWLRRPSGAYLCWGHVTPGSAPLHPGLPSAAPPGLISVGATLPRVPLRSTRGYRPPPLRGLSLLGPRYLPSAAPPGLVGCGWTVPGFRSADGGYRSPPLRGSSVGAGRSRGSTPLMEATVRCRLVAYFPSRSSAATVSSRWAATGVERGPRVGCPRLCLLVSPCLPHP